MEKPKIGFAAWGGSELLKSHQVKEVTHLSQELWKQNLSLKIPHCSLIGKKMLQNKRLWRQENAQIFITAVIAGVNFCFCREKKLTCFILMLKSRVWPKEMEYSVYSVKNVINGNVLHLFLSCCCSHEMILSSLKVLLNLLGDFLLREKKCFF